MDYQIGNLSNYIIGFFGTLGALGFVPPFPPFLPLGAHAMICSSKKLILFNHI
jgi:hypothetical protein